MEESLEQDPVESPIPHSKPHHSKPHSKSHSKPHSKPFSGHESQVETFPEQQEHYHRDLVLISPTDKGWAELSLTAEAGLLVRTNAGLHDDNSDDDRTYDAQVTAGVASRVAQPAQGPPSHSRPTSQRSATIAAPSPRRHDQKSAESKEFGRGFSPSRIMPSRVDQHVASSAFGTAAGQALDKQMQQHHQHQQPASILRPTSVRHANEGEDPLAVGVAFSRPITGADEFGTTPSQRGASALASAPSSARGRVRFGSETQVQKRPSAGPLARRLVRSRPNTSESSTTNQVHRANSRPRTQGSAVLDVGWGDHAAPPANTKTNGNTFNRLSVAGSSNTTAVASSEVLCSALLSSAEFGAVARQDSAHAAHATPRGMTAQPLYMNVGSRPGTGAINDILAKLQNQN